MKLLRDMFNDLDSFGRFWFGVGIVALVAAAAMSFDFGWGVSAKHAIFLAVLTIVAAFGPMAAEMLWGRGRKGPAIATAMICVPLLGIEFYSHAGYTAGLRGTNIESALVQNTRYDGAQHDVKRTTDELEMLKGVMARLQADAPWAGTVKADGLRARLSAAQKAIDLEAARGGCKAKCLAEMEKKAALEKEIAIAEKADDTQKRIAELQAIIDQKRTVAVATAHVSSAVAHQNDSLSRWVALVANGDVKASELQRAASQESANLAMAVAGTGLPAFALFLAGLFRLSRTKDRDDDTIDPPPSAKAPVTPYRGHAGIPAEPIHVHTTDTVHIKDATLRRWSLSDEVQALLSGNGQLKAA